MRIITMDEYEVIGREKVIEEIERTTGYSPIYISFDIDGLDAAQVMSTGLPEIGGLSPRDSQVMLRSLQGKRVVGAKWRRCSGRQPASSYEGPLLRGSPPIESGHPENSPRSRLRESNASTPRLPNYPTLA
jgi:Arginase family